MPTTYDLDFILKTLNDTLKKADANEANSIADEFGNLVIGKNNATVLCAIAFIISRISHVSNIPDSELFVYGLIGGILQSTQTTEATIN